MARIAKDYGYTLAELRRLSDDDHMSITLRAEFFVDDEANTWHYRVPALHINGGGTATREDAERDCLDAIEFALESDRATKHHAGNRPAGHRHPRRLKPKPPLTRPVPQAPRAVKPCPRMVADSHGHFASRGNSSWRAQGIVATPDL